MILTHRDRWSRRLAGGLMAMLALVVLCGGARAQVLDVYEVRDVPVDVTAETAAQAREQALAEGERQAFDLLLRRLTLAMDRDRLPTLDNTGMAALVKDFSVVEEKTSDVRYLAKLDFRFKREGVRNLLMDRGLPFAETASKPMVVLPVQESAAGLFLWDEPNPWRGAWRRLPPLGGLVPLVHPLGDLPDIAALGAQQALEGDAEGLAALVRRYNAGDALVAHAVIRADGAAERVDVLATRHGATGRGQTLTLTLDGQPGEPRDDLLSRAAAAVAAQVEDSWKAENLLQFGVPSILPAKVRIGGLNDWMAVRRALARVAVVRQVDLVLLSLDEARVNLHYLGDPEQLSLALRQADLALTLEGTEWVLAPVAGSGEGRVREGG